MKRQILYTLAIMFAVFQASAQTSVNYTYDALNRLTMVKYSNGVTINYTYDALGNRTKRIVNGSSQMRGDVDGDGQVNINDVAALVNYLLNHNSSGINMNNADCYVDGQVNINDVTSLINYLLSGKWE